MGFLKLAEGDQERRLQGMEYRDGHLQDLVMTETSVFGLASPAVRWCSRLYLNAMIRMAFEERAKLGLVCLKHLPPPEEGMRRYRTTGGMTFEGATIDSWMVSFDESGEQPDGIANIGFILTGRHYQVPVNEIVEFSTL